MYLRRTFPTIHPTNFIVSLQIRPIFYLLIRPLAAAWMLVLAGDGAARAQEDSSSLRNPAESSYNVIALRVEFQPDTTRFTTGNGTFDGSIFDTLSVTIDPLPHDADYFNAHLEFLSNYVRRVSDGQTVLQTHLVPEIVRLPHQMGHYSPTGSQSGGREQQQKLARLVEDAWTAADQQSDFDMSRFAPENTAFILFHAGAGRDIELVGTSLDNTPEDIPSVYLDPERLSELGGGTPTFNGFPVRHSMILPETESRLGVNPLTQAPYVAEFSINGMLAATFFNYLGAPDLFNTQTGASAIGPFGLMDPLGIFAYNGLFPPEPMAWTKYYLGWIDPPEMRLGQTPDISLTAVADTNTSDAVLVRISGAEYFLLENRHRDPQGDGLHLQVWKDGERTSQEISAGSENFSRFDPAAFIGGVVTGVDTYDWAIPGGTTEEGDIMRGGIAVWHIDERRVADGLASNTINTDPRHRGIDLEEADGAQDLGFTAESMFGSGSEQGTPFDLYFQGNPVRVVTDRGETVRLYENRFGPDTRPSSANAEGGGSFVELFDFSEPGREMTAAARLVPAADMQAVSNIRNYRIPGTFAAGSSVAALPSGPDTTFYFIPRSRGRDSIYTVRGRTDGAPKAAAWTSSQGMKPVRYGARLITLAPSASGSGAWALHIGDSARVELPVTGAEPVGAPVVIEEQDHLTLYAAFRSSEESVLMRWREGEEVELVTESLPADIRGLAGAGEGRLVVVGRGETIVRGGSMTWSYELPREGRLGGIAFGRDRDGLTGVLADTTDGALVILKPDGTTGRIAIDDAANGGGSMYPILGDLDGDGLLDILTAAGHQLKAYSRAGAVVADFPVPVPANVVTQPLLVRVTSDGRWRILVGATDGYIYSYEIGRSQQSSRGFPLAVGRSVAATPLLASGTLAAVSRSGTLQAWRFASVDTVAWGQLHADAQNRSYVEAGEDVDPLPPRSNGAELLSAERTYNWPNPVRDGRTHIRLLAHQRCDVQISIVDVAGTLVEEMSIDNVPANVPYETTWETDIPSGVYYARIKATAGDGNTDTELITIAVIK